MNTTSHRTRVRPGYFMYKICEWCTSTVNPSDTVLYRLYISCIQELKTIDQFWEAGESPKHFTMEDIRQLTEVYNDIVHKLGNQLMAPPSNCTFDIIADEIRKMCVEHINILSTKLHNAYNTVTDGEYVYCWTTIGYFHGLFWSLMRPFHSLDHCAEAHRSGAVGAYENACLYATNCELDSTNYSDLLAHYSSFAAFAGLEGAHIEGRHKAIEILQQAIGKIEGSNICQIPGSHQIILKLQDELSFLNVEFTLLDPSDPGSGSFFDHVSGAYHGVAISRPEGSTQNIYLSTSDPKTKPVDLQPIKHLLLVYPRIAI